MAVILAIAADHERQVLFLPAVKRRLAGVPAGLATALVVMVAGYWGLHATFYGLDATRVTAAIATLSPQAEHPHGAVAPVEPQPLDAVTTGGVAEGVDPASALFAEANERMHDMMVQDPTGDVDRDFVRGMIPHHRGAVEMAEIVLEHGEDPEIRALAEEILAHQEAEIEAMRDWLDRQGG